MGKWDGPKMAADLLYEKIARKTDSGEEALRYPIVDTVITAVSDQGSQNKQALLRSFDI
jgi:hypothetical protein